MNDDERRDFEELCKNNPNYPKVFELHRIFQSHIKKWKPLIESNDPSIYADWNGYEPDGHWGSTEWDEGYTNDDKERMRLIVQNLTADFSVASDWSLQDNEIRRRVMLFLLESYIFTVEKRIDYGRNRRTKPDIIFMIDRIDRTGRNPFDWDYYSRTASRKKDERTSGAWSRSLLKPTMREQQITITVYAFLILSFILLALYSAR